MKATPHINPTGLIADTVLLPGDPLRAKFIAETFLENCVQFNAVRNALGFTGTYKGREISVMGTGMGMPSIGIYSYELMNFFGVKNLIRTGSCGALQKNLKLYDVILGLAASTNSHYGDQYNFPGLFAPCASWTLVEAAKKAADTLALPVHLGNIFSSDTFYSADETSTEKLVKMGILGVEMEAAALYMNAAYCGANALCILTVSDHILTKEEITADAREKSFADMIKIALETALLV